MSEMRAIDIARRMLELGQVEHALQAYSLAIGDENAAPEELLESAIFILQAQGDYKLAYDCFLHLYQEGHFQEDCLGILTGAFYEPNMKQLQATYARNCKLLAKYPYLFRKDFLPFEELPIRFYPYDEEGYIPFDTAQARFGDYINFKYPVISRNFFKDLEKPILADDVYSQYELEYLNDNVRKSEHVARENHIYLHYTDWAAFCAHLQCLNMKPLLEDKKIVFLIGDEIGQYPIDFKARFGIDYSKYPLKPVGVREVSRMIWHTQLATHNGGDLFNEVFDGHPNLLYLTSVMKDTMDEGIQKLKDIIKLASNLKELSAALQEWAPPGMAEELYTLKTVTDKDCLVALFLMETDWNAGRDPAARIAPALFFQPHFHNIIYNFKGYADNRVQLFSDQADEIHDSAIFKDFKYIKTFVPLRRFTTSHGGSLRFMKRMLQVEYEEGKGKQGIPDAVMQRILNRSFMRDPRDRLYKDSVVVRFEDAKLNSTATFTALAAFVDLPYTETMTYCSFGGRPVDEVRPGSGQGFDTASVYRTYDDFVSDGERRYIERFLRDAYEFYGYDFQYYDGKPVDEGTVQAWQEDFTKLNELIRNSVEEAVQEKIDLGELKREELGMDEKEFRRQAAIFRTVQFETNRMKCARILLKGLRFVNKNGEDLEMIPMLQLDPALMTQPLYH